MIWLLTLITALTDAIFPMTLTTKLKVIAPPGRAMEVFSGKSSRMYPSGISIFAAYRSVNV